MDGRSGARRQDRRPSAPQVTKQAKPASGIVRPLPPSSRLVTTRMRVHGRGEGASESGRPVLRVRTAPKGQDRRDRGRNLPLDSHSVALRCSTLSFAPSPPCQRRRRSDSPRAHPPPPTAGAPIAAAPGMRNDTPASPHHAAAVPLPWRGQPPIGAQARPELVASSRWTTRASPVLRSWRTRSLGQLPHMTSRSPSTTDMP